MSALRIVKRPRFDTGRALGAFCANGCRSSHHGMRGITHLVYVLDYPPLGVCSECAGRMGRAWQDALAGWSDDEKAAA